MIDITLYQSSVLCKFDQRFKSYGKSCKVPLILFGLVTEEPGWAVIQPWAVSYSSWKIAISRSICALHDARMPSKIQSCDLIE